MAEKSPREEWEGETKPEVRGVGASERASERSSRRARPRSSFRAVVARGHREQERAQARSPIIYYHATGLTCKSGIWKSCVGCGFL